MTPDEDPTELLTIEEVAGRLKVREKTVRDWIGRGELDAYKIGKEWRVRRDHLDRHIEARRVGAPTRRHRRALGSRQRDVATSRLVHGPLRAIARTSHPR